MSIIDPSLCIKTDLTIENNWIDYNGHLNMGYYTVLFDQASDDVFAMLGMGPDYQASRKLTTYTVECHIRYLRELKLGDQLLATFHLISHDAKRFHAAQHLYHADGWLAATAEMLWLHIDQSGDTPKVAAFPADISAKIKALAQTQSHLGVPSFIGKPVGTRP